MKIDSAVEAFALIYPGARLAIVNQGNVVAYVDPEEAKLLLSSGKYKMVAQAGKNSLSLVVIDGKHRSIHPRTKRRVKEDCKGKCAYCGIPVNDNATLDHRVPVIRCGNNGADNLLVACTICNCDKGTMTEEEYRLYLSRVNGG